MADFLAQLAEILTPIGWGAVGLVVAGWLAVAFAAAGKPREILESLSATLLFVALLALFANLVDNAIRDGSALRMTAFGILMAIFSCSTALCCVQTLLLARGRASDPTSATN